MRFAVANVSFVLSCATVAAQPLSIYPDGVLNAASDTPSGLLGSGIAQGAMFVAKGTGLGAGPLVFPGTRPLTTEMAGTSIRFSVGESTTDALLVYTTSYQVAACFLQLSPW